MNELFGLFRLSKEIRVDEIGMGEGLSLTEEILVVVLVDEFLLDELDEEKTQIQQSFPIVVTRPKLNV